MTARTLAGMLRARADAEGDAVAIRFRRADGWLTWTWAEYWRQAQRMALGLAVHGVAAGDHVILLVPEIDRAVAALFGLWTLGAVPSFVGVPYRLSDFAGYVDQLALMAQQLRAKAIVVSASVAAMAKPRVRHVGEPMILVADALLDDHAGQLGGLDASRLDPERTPDPCLVQLTSGSTAHPRGVALSHDRLMRHMASMSSALPSVEDDVAVSWLPLHHDMGLIGGLLFPFFNGFPAHMLSPLAFRSRPFSWLEAMSEVRGTICAAPPSAYAICVSLAERAAEVGLDLSPWRVAMVGAEQVSPDLLRRFSRAFAPCGFRAEAFFPVYGLAEATVAVTFPRKLTATRFDRIDRQALERDSVAVPCADERYALELTGVGMAIPHTEVRVVDDALMDLADRHQGEVLVRSSSLMLGYHRDEAATAATMAGDWLKTGDLGYLVDGTLFITGRKKELIIKGGHNLVPSVIEDLATTVDGVRAGCLAAVGLRSHERETELVCLVAETRLERAAHPALDEQIRERLRVNGITLDKVVLVAPGTLPKTTSGKIQRGAVAEALRRGDLGAW